MTGQHAFNNSSPIFVAGHRGLAGSAIVSELRKQGCAALVLRTREELDLRDAAKVSEFFREHRPAYVILAAARVGGIAANNEFPAEFITENLQIQTNVISAAQAYGVSRLIFLGSSCIYPKLCPQPIKEEYLLTGPLEPTNRPYAIAKIAGVEMCWASNRQYGTQFIAAIPTNLYGSGNSSDLHLSHMLPALLHKAHTAKTSGADAFTVWGSGTPMREMMHVDDLARACVHLLRVEAAALAPVINNDEPPLINIGTGEDHSIRDIARLVASTVGFTGDLHFDATKPDGTPRKLLDVSRIQRLGWHHTVSLENGLADTYAHMTAAPLRPDDIV